MYLFKDSHPELITKLSSFKPLYLKLENFNEITNIQKICNNKQIDDYLMYSEKNYIRFREITRFLFIHFNMLYVNYILWNKDTYISLHIMLFRNKLCLYLKSSVF